MLAAIYFGKGKCGMRSEISSSIKVERSFDLDSNGDRIAVFQSWFKPPMLSCLDGSRGQAKWCTLQHIDRGGPSFSRDYDR